VIALPAISFLCAVLIAIASSVWIPSGARLGKPFWLLALVLVVSALIWPVIFLLQPTDPYGFSPLTLVPSMLFFGPVAGGWLFGTLIVFLVRVARQQTN
jgi:hypothetical protein